MTTYTIDFEYAQWGDVTLEADDEEHAEELAIEKVAEVHGIDPTDITVLSVVENNAEA